MIKYNFRYRGPFEKDKFSLSILEMNNKIQDSLENYENKVNMIEEMDKEIEEKFNEDSYGFKIYKEVYRRGL